MPALKDEISAASVAALQKVVSAAVAPFDGRAFYGRAIAGLAEKELKARIAAVADALGESLPGPFRADAPAVAGAVAGSKLTVWEAWPALTWVERFGLDDPDASLDALAAMTGRASAEFAIRPFLAAHAEETWERLDGWARSSDPDLRRLVSEGTRPRLPWGTKVDALLADPSRALSLLDLLYDDDAEYVRRSVANHVNDVGRVDPELALETVERWQSGGGNDESFYRHALRGLVKRGDERALALLGVDVGARLEIEMELTSRVAIGEAVELAATIANPGRCSVTAEVDYAIHFARPSGKPSRTVFKLARIELGPRSSRRLQRRIAMQHRSIRALHAGRHLLDLQVNGRVAASAAFELLA